MKQAVMELAHTMLIIGYHILKSGRDYHGLGGIIWRALNRDQLQKYYLMRLQKLGLKVAVKPAIQAT